MKIYIVNIKFAYCEYYDIDKAEAYLSRDKAAERMNELCIDGYNGEDLDDVYIQEYEVRDAKEDKKSKIILGFLNRQSFEEICQKCCITEGEAEQVLYFLKGKVKERNRLTIVLTAERTTIPASLMWTVRRYGIIATDAGKNSPSMTKRGITVSIEPGRASRGRTRHRLKPFSKCKVPMAGYYIFRSTKR